MDEFHLTPEMQCEIEHWRSQSAYHLGFSDKQAWQEIQTEKYAKTLAGRVDKKIVAAKMSFKSGIKSAMNGAWQGVKGFSKTVWNNINRQSFQKFLMVVGAGCIIAVALFITFDMIIYYFVPWSVYDLTTSVPSISPLYDGAYSNVKIDSNNKRYAMFVPITDLEVEIRKDGLTNTSIAMRTACFLNNIDYTIIFVPDEASRVAWQEAIAKAKKIRADYVQKQKEEMRKTLKAFKK